MPFQIQMILKKFNLENHKHLNMQFIIYFYSKNFYSKKVFYQN